MSERRSSAIEFHEKGLEAFDDNKFQEAIKFYTAAIEFEPSAKFYSNRSAAYLKHGNFEEALKDADQAIQHDPKFAKGYARKGAVLVAMKKFDTAILNYKEGLAQCPEDKTLQKGLASAKRSKMGFQESTRGSMVAARKGRASMRASMSLKKKAENAQGVSEFVRDTRKALKLEMALLQSQLELLDALAAMSDDEKLEMLFILLDKNGDGFINAQELSDGIRKRNEGLSFAESLDRAINVVAVFDEDGDTKLNPEEFKTCMTSMTKELGSDFHEFSEFLILQMIFLPGNDPVEELAGALVNAEISEEVKGREELIDILVDPRLVQLFMLFDKNGDGLLNFKEVAIGLYQLTMDMEGSIKATVDLLLMMDKDDTRTLNYEQFARLILSICAAAEKPFDDIADDLTLALTGDTIEMTEEDLAGLIISDEIYSAAKDIQGAVEEEAQVQDILGYARLLKLFDLLDENNDGGIDAQELASGLKRFHTAMGIDGDAELEAMLLLIANDETGNFKLGREEFARAMVKYASASEVDAHDLVDFMSVTALIDSDSGQGYQAAVRKSMTGDMMKTQTVQIEYYELYLLEDVDEEPFDEK